MKSLFIINSSLLTFDCDVSRTFGGDEEGRTPVQILFHINFYEYSLFFTFPQIIVNKQTIIFSIL